MESDVWMGQKNDLKSLNSKFDPKSAILK